MVPPVTHAKPNVRPSFNSVKGTEERRSVKEERRPICNQKVSQMRRIFQERDFAESSSHQNAGEYQKWTRLKKDDIKIMINHISLLLYQRSNNLFIPLFIKNT